MDPDVIFESLKKTVDLDEVFGPIWTLGVTRWQRDQSDTYNEQLKMKFSDDTVQDPMYNVRKDWEDYL